MVDFPLSCSFWGGCLRYLVGVGGFNPFEKPVAFPCCQVLGPSISSQTHHRGKSPRLPASPWGGTWRSIIKRIQKRMWCDLFPDSWWPSSWDACTLEHLTITYMDQLMPNWWFGAGWFGIRIRYPEVTIPFIRDSDDSKPPTQTTNLPLAE